MLRRQALTLGSLLLGAVTLGGWTLFKQKAVSYTHLTLPTKA